MEGACTNCKKSKLMEDKILVFSPFVSLIGNVFIGIGYLSIFIGAIIFVTYDSKNHNEIQKNPSYNIVYEGFSSEVYRKKSPEELTREYLRAANIPDKIVDKVIFEKSFKDFETQLTAQQKSKIEIAQKNLALINRSRHQGWSFFDYWWLFLLTLVFFLFKIGGWLSQETGILKCYSCGFKKK